MPVRCKYLMLVDGEFISRVIGNLSTRLFHNEKSCRTVPWFQFMLVKTIKAASGHPAKIDRCRTKPSDWHPFANKSFKDLKRTVAHIDIGLRKAGKETG